MQDPSNSVSLVILAVKNEQGSGDEAAKLSISGCFLRNQKYLLAHTKDTSVT